MTLCPYCREEIQEGAIKCKHCKSMLAPAAIPSAMPPLPATTAETENLLRRLADYEKISGIFWIVLAVVQICFCVTAICGIWNIFVGVSRIKTAPLIRQRNPKVPSMFEGTGQLVVLAIVNLLLGAVIGVVLIAFDFYIRDKVLSNAHLFSAAAVDPAPSLTSSQ